MQSRQTGHQAAMRPASGRQHPALAWLGWTILLAALVTLMIWLVPSGGIWGALLAVTVVGVLSSRWSFLFSPLAVGLACLGWIAAAAMVDRDSRFAIEAGYQWAVLAIALMIVGGTLAAALGIAIGQQFRATRRPPRA